MRKDCADMTEPRISIKDDRKKRWLWIDNAVFNGYAAKMQPNGIAVYCALVRHANNDTAKAWPSIRTIAEEIGVSSPTVLAAIERLEELELIAVERPGAPKSNVYTVLEAPMLKEIAHDVSSMCKEVAHDVQGDCTELNYTKHELKERENILLFESLQGHTDKAAIADPSVKPVNAIEEVARQLAPAIDWVWAGTGNQADKKLLHAAEQLLGECSGDVDGTLEALDTYLDNPKNRRWALEKAQDPHWLISSIAGQYQKQRAEQQRHDYENTTAGRRERYAGGKYADYIQS